MSGDKIVHRWTKAQNAYLRSSWGRVPLAEICEVLGRSEDAVKQRAWKLLGTTLDREPKTERRVGPSKGKGPYKRDES